MTKLKSRLSAPRASYRSSEAAIFAPLQTQSAPDSRGLPLPLYHRNKKEETTNEEDEEAKIKYNKRLQRARRRKRQPQGTPSGNNVLLQRAIVLAVLFVFVLGFWKLVGRLMPNSRKIDHQARRERAARLWKEREGGERGTDQEEGDLSDHSTLEEWEWAFAHEQLLAKGGSGPSEAGLRKILDNWLYQWDSAVEDNTPGGIRWIRPYLLPPLPGQKSNIWHDDAELRHSHRKDDAFKVRSEFFHSRRNDGGASGMAWSKEWESLSAEQQNRGPTVDYTNPDLYTYPEVRMEPPAEGGYPIMRTLKEVLSEWPQDEDLEGGFTERLIHFNFSNPTEREAAARFRDAELPFKLYDVPELTAANAKWTDDYVAEQFGTKSSFHLGFSSKPLAQGNVQESPNNFFAFFTPKHWTVDTMGVPPTRNNDWSYATWAKHARYADSVSLQADQPHYYMQAGVPAEERSKPEDQWTFISRDLPSWSQPSDSTFFVFHPEEQKGIQCRFGERGVVAATHYDSGRNMIAMVTGAKRYILAPPNQCSKLGIFTSRKSPIYRHSLLNFGHIQHLDSDKAKDMSEEERVWLERASSSMAIDTVLKAGEVLYIPSFYFHYIVSIQKSAQCNARSGINREYTSTEFGGFDDVIECLDK